MSTQKEFSAIKALKTAIENAPYQWPVHTLIMMALLHDDVEREAGKFWNDGYPFELWKNLELKINTQFLQLKQEIIATLEGKTASTAEELFPSETNKKKAFEELVHNFLRQYEGDVSVDRSDGVVIITRTGRSSGWWAKTKVKLLDNGEIEVVFTNSENNVESKEIIPIDAGFIDHNYSVADTYLPNDVIQELIYNREQFCQKAEITEEEAEFLFWRRKGWLATTEIFHSRMSRAITKGDQYRPIRIGYMIYAEGVLETIKKIKSACPEYWEPETQSDIQE